MRNPFISLGDQSIRYDLITGFKLTKIADKDRIMVFLSKNDRNQSYDPQGYYICDWIFFTKKEAIKKVGFMEEACAVLTEAYGIPMGSKVNDET